MSVNEIENDLELQRVLWACYEYWKNEPLPVSKRAICYSWIVKRYEKRFGTRFHQSRLRRLAELGFLVPEDDPSRGGHRRYYKISDPNRVYELLRKWNWF